MQRKLSDAQVAEIKRRLLARSVFWQSQRSIAEEFGVSHTLIHQIWDALRLRGLFTRNIGSSLFFADRSSTIIQDDIFERLTTLPNVIVTGHQGFLTREAIMQIAEITLSNISKFQSGREDLDNLVKPRSQVTASMTV